MIIYNSKTINDWNFDTSNLIKVYRNNAICYYKVSGGGDVPTAQTPCYAVVTGITQYQDTEFVDVYNKADESWYKLNNLNQYEKYGVYGSGRTICQPQPSRLPDGYTEVEYIENSGTTSSTCAFINLGIALYDQADNTFTVVSRLKSEYYSASGDGTMETIINSEGISSPYNGFVYRYKYNTGGQQLELGGNNNNATLTTVENEDGSRTVTIQSVSAATFTAQTPLGLFASYNGSYTNPYRPSKTKIYSCQVTLNNELVRNLVPAKRDSDSKYGLYDLVTDTFYISPNGNNFVGGESVNPSQDGCVTVYEGKLTIDDGYEYMYSGNSWVNVGEVSGSSITIKSPEYIERTSSYNGYCSLLEYLTQDTKIIIKHKQTAAGGGRIIGDYNSNDNDDWRFFFFGSTLYYDFITQRKSTSFGMPMSAAQEWEVGNYYIKNTANSSNILTGTPQTFSSRPTPMYIYHSDGVGAGESGRDYGQIYYIKIYRGDTLVRDFIPWTDMEGNYGLYDKVQNELVHTVGSMTASTTINDVEVSGGYSYPIYYSDKIDPPTEVSFDTMDEALAYDCPYVGLIALIDGQAYMFNDEYEWEQLAFTITGTTTSSDPFSLKLNLEDATVTVYQDNGDGTYNWGIYYSTPITNTSGLCSGNTSLRSFDWGDADTSGLTTLGNYSFSNCKSLTTMPSIPSNVTTIGQSAFAGCTGISSSTITIPEGITSLGSNSFSGFFRNGTKTLNLPSTLSSIGSYAFSDSNQTVNVTIDSLEHWLNISMGQDTSNPIKSSGWLYINGNGVQDVTVPNNISKIKEFVFYNYKHLNSLTIPSNVTSIGYYAFYGVSPITSVTIPSSVTFIGQNSFYYSSLKNVVYNSSAYNNYIFAHCSSLSSVTLSNITRIGSYMFQYCYALSSITIPSSVTYINDYAFGSCTALTSVDIPSSVASIGYYTFGSCSKLSAITIPSSVTSISNNAFNSCTSLTTVTVEATTPPSLGTNVFQGCTALSQIYVPCQSVSAYRSANNWSTYADKIVGYEECTTYEWQTISSAYTCYEGDKYEKQQKMRSFDSGTTWEAVVPAEYQRGQLIESGSSDCGCRLPDGYTEVEYITSENTSSNVSGPYIDTNLIPNQNTRVVLDYQPIVNGQYNRRIFGSGEYNTVGYVYNMESYVGQSSCYYYYKYGNNSSWYTTNVHPDLNRHTVDFNNNGRILFDGTSIATLESTTFTCTFNLGLFRSIFNNYTSMPINFLGRVYSCQVYDNSTLIRDLVPCINQNNAAGMYDMVNDVFYTTANASYQFEAGPEVPCGKTDYTS